MQTDLFGDGFRVHRRVRRVEDEPHRLSEFSEEFRVIQMMCTNDM